MLSSRVTVPVTVTTGASIKYLPVIHLVNHT